MVKLHKHLFSTAVKLSVFSAFLDLGLTLSILFKGSFLPAVLSNFFEEAITGLTVAIIALFVLSFFLKSHERIVNIYVNKQQSRVMDVPKVAVTLSGKGLEKPVVKAVIKGQKFSVANPDDMYIQRFVNSKKQSFMKVNGLWYKYVNNSKGPEMERVRIPEYE